MQFFRDTNIQFMRYRRRWAIVSVLAILLGWGAELVRGGLNVGIDFAGGTQLTLKFAERPELDRLRGLLQQAGFPAAQLQRFGEPEDNEVLIKTPTREGSEEGSQAAIVAALDRALNPAGDRFDLNQAGTESLADHLYGLDPDRVRDGGALEAQAHYQAVAEAIRDAETEVGMFTSWEQVAVAPGVSSEVLQALRDSARLGEFKVLGAENVGPQVGRELRRKGILAVVFSMIGMLAYIWVRFELRFGIGALVATLHDVLFTLALFALTRYEFNLTTIAAFLTLVGYSVNDTVVVFDRVRENMRRNPRQPFEETLNLSINQMLSRTVLTSGTTLLAVGSLLLWGGDVLRGFAFILTVGIVVGTYSSIYIAAPYALWWDQRFGRAARTARKEATKAEGRA